MTQLQELIVKAKQSVDMATCDIMDAHELASPIEKIVISFALSDARHLLDQLANLEAVLCGEGSDAAIV